MFVFMFVFMILYVNDHRQLNELKKEHDPGINIDHKERLRLRKVKLQKICTSLSSPSRVEHGSIFDKPIPNNECTGTFFKVDTKRHFICNGLKTGSTSWQVFFAENHINTTHIRDCRADNSCPSSAQTGLRIVQVRHPFERLLSSYRHVFKNGGWKSLDQTWQHDKELEKSFAKIFSISWRELVERALVVVGHVVGQHRDAERHAAVKDAKNALASAAEQARRSETLHAGSKALRQDHHAVATAAADGAARQARAAQLVALRRAAETQDLAGALGRWVAALLARRLGVAEGEARRKPRAHVWDTKG